MELALVDTFVRPEPPKGGTRAADTPTVSFSDMLDESARRRPEPAVRSRDNNRATDEPRRELPETASARDNDAPKARPDSRPEAGSDAKANETRPQPPANPARSKTDSSKQDANTAPAEAPAEAASADDLSDAAPTGETAAIEAAQIAANGKGATALDWLADLLAGGNPSLDAAQPKGQMVAAIVVPQNVPQHATAAANHTIPGLTAPAAAPTMPTVPTGEAAPALPAGTAATPAPAAPNSFAPAGEPMVSTPPGLAPTSGATPAMAEASADAPPAAPSVSTVPASSPAPAATPAASTPSPSATATPVAMAEPVVAEMADVPDLPLINIAMAEEGAAPANSSTGSQTTSRPNTSQATSSGFVAQVVSQDAPGNDAPVAANAPAGTDLAAAARLEAKAAPLPAESLTPVDDSLAPARPGDPLALVTGDSGHARETHSIESAATRAARAHAVPVPEQVVVRIAKAIADGVDRINVKLSPAELGHIDVRMEIGPDGRFQAVFAADRPQTVELLQRDARELARALQDAGLRADTGSLSFNLRGQGQQGHADGAPGHGGSLPLAAGGDDLPGNGAPPPVYRASGPGAGRVDIRV